MSACNISATPFDKIALSLSGGGYRAATFHLGAMYYLYSLEYDGRRLLDQVEMISTVSGGTITGVVYSMMKADDKEFIEFYEFMLSKLKTIDLISESLAKLDAGKQLDTTTKHKNLINAFAELYNYHFTKDKTLSDLAKANAVKATVFNSTEFNNAVDFRFMNDACGYTGNNYLKIDVAAAAEIRLSDIIAASSCFPGGFEPIVWPHDFIHSHSPNLAALSQVAEPVGLMDGGIYDNQGIEAILNYENGHAQPYFDLIIISDVASPYMQHYKPTPEVEKKGWYTWTLDQVINNVNSFSRKLNFWLIGGLLLTLLLPFAWHYTNAMVTGVFVGLGIALAVLLVTKLIFTGKVVKAKEGLLKKLRSIIPPEIYKGLAQFNFGTLSLHRVEPLLLNRLNSVLILMMDAFLKIVRRLNYDVLYENKQYEQRRISNLVQELTRKDFELKIGSKKKRASDERLQNSLIFDVYDKSIGTEIENVVKDAAAFGTTLWFSEKQQLDDLLNKLVITGKVTMCYNMLEYLENVLFEPKSGFAALSLATQEQLKKTYETCKTDWLALQVNPSDPLKR